MGIKNNIFAFNKSNTILLTLLDAGNSLKWLLGISKMADHSLIPRSSPLFKMAVESNFPPWGPLWMSKSPPTCALRSLIPVGCPAPPSWGKPLIGALRSVNTLNSKAKFKTILINKSQLLLKGVYLEATWTFLRFAAKYCSIAQLFGASYQLYAAICCIFQTLQREII